MLLSPLKTWTYFLYLHLDQLPRAYFIGTAVLVALEGMARHEALFQTPAEALAFDQGFSLPRFRIWGGAA